MRGPDCAMRGELLEWALDSGISSVKAMQLSFLVITRLLALALIF